MRVPNVHRAKKKIPLERWTVTRRRLPECHATYKPTHEIDKWHVGRVPSDRLTAFELIIRAIHGSWGVVIRPTGRVRGVWNLTGRVGSNQEGFKYHGVGPGQPDPIRLVRYGMVCYGMLWYGMVRYGIVYREEIRHVKNPDNNLPWRRQRLSGTTRDGTAPVDYRRPQLSTDYSTTPGTLQHSKTMVIIWIACAIELHWHTTYMKNASKCGEAWASFFPIRRRIKKNKSTRKQKVVIPWNRWPDKKTDHTLNSATNHHPIACRTALPWRRCSFFRVSEDSTTSILAQHRL